MAKQGAFLLGLLAEDFLHAGTGQSTGLVDLPVAREAHSGWPFVPDTALKGALKEHDREAEPTSLKGVYGSQDGAGEALIGGARLLLLPVRHLEGSYAWTTCPALLQRFQRDQGRVLGLPVGPAVPAVADTDVLTSLGGLSSDGPSWPLRFEDLELTRKPLPEQIGTLMAQVGALMADSPAALRLPGQIAVVSDRIFNEFASFALPVQARNSLNDDKQSTNLWYEETLPPDTLLYAPIASRSAPPSAAFEDFKGRLDRSYRRVGGNETVGQGWVRTVVWMGAS